MSILSAIQSFLGTATWRRSQAETAASERFHTFDHNSAVAVLDCLVHALGVTFQQLHPETDLAKDLGADEDEPQWISWMLQDLGISISPQQVVDARTVAGLIDSVARASHESVR